MLTSTGQRRPRKLVELQPSHFKMGEPSQKKLEPPRLEVRKVGKRFPGVRALHEVDFDLGEGEVLALIGENGAGKSTLMKILAGVQPPDHGEVLVDGIPIVNYSVPEAMGRGISLIHQELNLADNLDVGANVFLGREPRNGFIDKKLESVKNLGSFCRQLGLIWIQIP